MYYLSTRDKTLRFTPAQAIAQGLSRDGGLFVPETIPQLPAGAMDKLKDMTYQQRAAYVMSLYLDGFTQEELGGFAERAYGPDKFDTSAVAPLRKVDDATYCLELWHGPTCAFKDMALQMLPHLLTASLLKNEEEQHRLHSGGHLRRYRQGVRWRASRMCLRPVFMVFYPKDGVSDIQELQMRTQEGDNVGVCAVMGNFDDAQTGVKKLSFRREAARDAG